MSAANGYSAVVQLIADRSSVDAAIASLPKEIRIPVVLDSRGSGLSPSSPGVFSGNPATDARAAMSGGGGGYNTFSNATAGRPPGISPSSPGFGGGGNSFNFSSSSFSFSPQFNQILNQLNLAINQVSQSFNTLTQNLTTVTNNLSSISTSISSSASSTTINNVTNNMRGPAAPRSPFAGLSRYLGVGILTHEALGTADLFRQRNIDQILSGGQPGGMLQSELSFYDRLSGIPIVGQAAGLLNDPTGLERAGIDQTMRAAGLQDASARGSFAFSLARTRAERQAGVVASTGFARRFAAIESSYQTSVENINQQYGEQAQRVRAEMANQRVGVLADLQGSRDHLQSILDSGDPAGGYAQRQIASVDARIQSETQRFAGLENQRLGALQAERDRAIAAQLSMRNSARRELYPELYERQESLYNEGLIAAEQGSRYPRRWYMRQLERNQVDVQASAVQREYGPQIADQFRASGLARLAAGNEVEDYALSGRQLGALGAARSGFLRAGNAPFAARINDLWTSYIQRSATNRDPEMARPMLAEFLGAIAAQGGDTLRSFGSYQLGLTTQQNVTQAMLRHDPLGARLAGIEGQRQAALRTTSSLPWPLRWLADRGIDAAYGAESALARQNFSEEGQLALFGINSRTAAFNLASGVDPRSAGQPAAVRSAMAGVSSLLSGIRSQQAEAIRAGRPDVAAALARQGTAQLLGLRASLYEGQAEEVSPFGVMRQGQPGSTDTSALLKSMNDAILQLRTIVKTIADAVGQGGKD